MASEDKELNEFVEFFKMEREGETRKCSLDNEYRKLIFNILLSFLIAVFAALIAFQSNKDNSSDPIGIYILIWFIAMLIILFSGNRSFKQKYDENKKHLEKYDLIINALQTRKILNIETDLSTLKNLVKQRYLHNKQQVTKDKEAWLNGILYCAYCAYLEEPSK